jgi:hypothetical protein
VYEWLQMGFGLVTGYILGYTELMTTIHRPLSHRPLSSYTLLLIMDIPWPTIRCHSNNFRPKTPACGQVKVEVIVWPTAGRPVCPGVRQPSGPLNQIFITFRQMWVCWCGAPSLTKERIGSLQLPLVLASEPILEPEFHGTLFIFYCLRFETPPTWRTRSPYLYPPGRRWSCYASRHWVNFLFPALGGSLDISLGRNTQITHLLMRKSRYDWWSVSTSSCRAHCGTRDQILIVYEICCFVSVGRPLSREVGSVSCRSLSAVIVHRNFSFSPPTFDMSHVLCIYNICKA